MTNCVFSFCTCLHKFTQNGKHTCNCLFLSLSECQAVNVMYVCVKSSYQMSNKHDACKMELDTGNISSVLKS